MAESHAKKDVTDDRDVVELSDSDDASPMKEFRHMITRPDWLQIFKKKCEEERLAELRKKSEVVLSPASPALSEPTKNTRRKGRKVLEAELSPTSPALSEPAEQNSRRKGRKVQSTAEPVCVSLPDTQRRQQHKANQRHASRGKRRRNRRCVQSDTCETGDPEIVFLSDSESDIRAIQASELHSRINVTSATGSNNGIEIISVSSRHEDSDVEEMVDQDTEIKVFFCWRDNLLKLPMKQSTQFGTILSTLCNSWAVQGSDIMLLHKNKIIKADDTPGICEMLTGSVVECSVVKSKTSVDAADPNVITIKLQTKNSRDKKPLAVHKMAQFQSIIEQFAEKEGVPTDKIVFKFDGDTISPTDTPFGLGIEDNYSIDVTY